MKAITPKLAFLLSPLLGTLAAGCGEAVSSDRAPAIGILRGHITGPSVATSHPLRLALVWERHDGEGNLVVQETAIEPVFPARFTLTLTEPPPEVAMTSVNVSVDGAWVPIRTAWGHFAVYEDMNENGAFDLVRQGADRAIDRLLSDGDYGRIAIRYLEGPADAVSKPYVPGVSDCAAGAVECSQPRAVSWRQGLNVARLTSWPQTGDACVATPCRLEHAFGDVEVLDANAEIELTLNTPAFSTIQCDSWSSPDAASLGACPNDVAPAGWGIGCFRAGYFALSPQDPSAPVCELRVQSCEVSPPAGGPLPADWPCP